MHRNPETLTTFFSSDTKRLLTSWRLSARGERDSFYYADCSIWPNKRAAHPVTQLDWSRPGSILTSLVQRQISTNCFFSKSPRIPAHRFWAWRHSHPSPIFHLGFLLWHLWLLNPPRASVNTCIQCVHLHVH